MGWARAERRPRSQRASRPGFQLGDDQAGGPIEVLEDSLAREIAAADGSLHRGRPARVGPVAGQKEAIHPGPLGRSQAVHTGSDSKGCTVLGHDPPS